MANDEKKQKKNKHFFKDFKAELKKVIWPTPKQLVNNTVAVITIVLILAIIVFFLDVAFEALNTYGIDKIRSAVSTSVEEQPQETVSEENAENEKTTDGTEEKSDDKENKKAEDSKDLSKEDSDVKESE